MPVIVEPLQDPYDLVIQGEILRILALAAPVTGTATAQLAPQVDTSTPVFIAAEERYIPMYDYPVPQREVLGDQSNATLISVNSVLATTTGALLLLKFSVPLIERVPESTVRWTIIGVTRDSTGTPLGNCRVVVLEVARIAVDGAPVVAQTVSDGSGNYSVIVPTNTAYQVMAYLTGAPSLAGVSLETLTAVAA